MKPDEINNDTSFLVEFACSISARVLADVDLPSRRYPTAKRVVDKKDVRAGGVDHPHIDTEPAASGCEVSGARSLKHRQRLVADMKGTTHFVHDVGGVVG